MIFSYVAGVKPTDISSGPGIRVTVYLSGCPHKCEGCHNPETWDRSYGKPYEEVRTDIQNYLNKPYVTGLTICGGEPFTVYNIDAAKDLAEYAHSIKKDVWAYSGYHFIDLRRDPQCELLKMVDFLVDGDYHWELRDISLKYRGSTNQRIYRICVNPQTEFITAEDVTNTRYFYRGAQNG